MTANAPKGENQPKARVSVGLVLGAALIVFAIGGYLVAQLVLPGLPTVPSASSVDANFPPLVLQRADGTQFNLKHDHGEATVLFAMAYWCGTCVPEAQALAKLQDELGPTGLVVVPIDIDPTSTPELLGRFVVMAGASNLGFAFDTGGAFVQTFNVQTLDTTIILNASGAEVYRDQYPTTYDTLRAELEEVLGR